MIADNLFAQKEDSPYNIPLVYCALEFNGICKFTDCEWGKLAIGEGATGQFLRSYFEELLVNTIFV